MKIVALLLLAAAAPLGTSAWIPQAARTVSSRPSTTELHAESSRKDFLASACAVCASAAASAVAIPPQPAYAKGINLGDPKSVVGREIQSFNGLIYNFKNERLDGGLDASTISEPSIPFIEFGEKMKKGEVSFVEFIAPYGDVAYATIGKGKPIRIGQGYPTRSKTSWSSPDYVIRSVSNFGVPYKFTVPALEKFRVK